MKPPFDIQKIRNEFPILQLKINGKSLVYLDNAATTQKPLSVLNAIENYYRTMNANVHRGNYFLSQHATEAYENARECVRGFLNADSCENIIFTRGTTEAINLVASGFARKLLKNGDEVVITAMEHHSNIVPWQLACEQSGATLKVIPVSKKGELILDEAICVFSEKTKILALTHISNVLGTINPVKEIILKAHKQGIPVLIDGAQAAPHLKVDVQELDCDFYCLSGHKIYASTGIGVLYGKKEWLEKLPPYQGGGEMIDRVTFEKTTYNVLPYKFEAGTPDICGAIALSHALKFLTEITIEKIAQWEHQLLVYGTQKLALIPGLEIIGNSDQKASVISFIVNGIHPSDIGILLDKMGVSVRTGTHCAQPLMDFYEIPGTVRASFAFYNTMEEIDLLAEGVAKAVEMLR